MAFQKAIWRPVRGRVSQYLAPIIGKHNPARAHCSCSASTWPPLKTSRARAPLATGRARPVAASPGEGGEMWPDSGLIFIRLAGCGSAPSRHSSDYLRARLRDSTSKISTRILSCARSRRKLPVATMLIRADLAAAGESRGEL